MRHAQRGGGGLSAIPEPTQETVCFDALTPWALTEAINQTVEKMAVKVVSVSCFAYHLAAFPPPEVEEKFEGHGPFYAIVVFEEDIPS